MLESLRDLGINNFIYNKVDQNNKSVPLGGMPDFLELYLPQLHSIRTVLQQDVLQEGQVVFLDDVRFKNGSINVYTYSPSFRDHCLWNLNRLEGFIDVLHEKID